MTRVENKVALAIHRYVEWNYPGETNQASAKRGIIHYNCAVYISNSSLLTAIAAVAFTVLGLIHIVFGVMLLGLASYVHLEASKHLHRLNPFLEDLLVGFIRGMNGPQTNEGEIAKEMAHQMQPINFFSLTSWYKLIPKI